MIDKYKTQHDQRSFPTDGSDEEESIDEVNCNIVSAICILYIFDYIR
jgi:hypothetical protein